jgi:hypothetical protein
MFLLSITKPLGVSAATAKKIIGLQQIGDRSLLRRLQSFEKRVMSQIGRT